MSREAVVVLFMVLLISADSTRSDKDFTKIIKVATSSSGPELISSTELSSGSELESSRISSNGIAQHQHHIPDNLPRSDTNITVQIGSHAYLPCNVRQLFGKPVSWVRVRDGHILTVDQTTFIADQRYQSIYAGNRERWSLQIKYVQQSDTGLYECQVSTEPKISARVYLKVIVPRTELIGDHNRFVKHGSKVALHCIVRGSLEPPSYIIWFRGSQQIVQGNNHGLFVQIDREIFGNSSDQQNTIGSLIIPFVTKRDSGNYTCSPSNSPPVTVDLHVLNGEYSASAIMSSAGSFNGTFWIILIVISLIVKRLS